LEAAGADKRRVAALAESLDDLVDDGGFWRFQARGLAVFATPERQTDAELGSAARAVLDGLYRDRIGDWADLYRQHGNEGRATTDIAQAARAATFGAVQRLLVDMDQVLPGTVDERDGTIALAHSPSADTYGVADEIARRVLLSGGEVLSVRQSDIPDGKPLAAILRYPL
jgi:hypothetical protein